MTGLLPILFMLIPLLACALSVLEKRNFFLRVFDVALPILFFADLIGLMRQAQNLAEARWFYFDKTIFIFLLLLNFLWLVFTLYSQRLWYFNAEKKVAQLRIFFTFTITLLLLIFVSKNLMSTLFFYSCLILFAQFFSIRLLRQSEVGFLRLFTFLLYFESFFFFLAIVATYKFLGGIDFVKGGISDKMLIGEEYFLLVGLYFLGLFFSALIPYFVFFRRPNIEPIITYILFFLGYSLGSICIFIKLITSVFPAKFFAELGFGLVEMVFLFNLLIAAGFMLFARGIKLTFFYLFFQEFFFVIFAVIFFATFRDKMIHASLLSFSLSFTLVFFCISNITLYLSRSGEGNISGLFYFLPVNSVLLIFAIVSMAGFLPTVNAVEKFLMLKVIWQKHLWTSLLIVIIHSAALLAFAAKMIFYFFSDHEDNEEHLSIARDIDFDSRLILTALLTALLMLAGIFVTKFI